MASFDHYTIVNPDNLAMEMQSIKMDQSISVEEACGKMESVLCGAMEKLGYGSAIDIYLSIL